MSEDSHCTASRTSGDKIGGNKGGMFFRESAMLRKGPYWRWIVIMGGILRSLAVSDLPTTIRSLSDLDRKATVTLDCMAVAYSILVTNSTSIFPKPLPIYLYYFSSTSFDLVVLSSTEYIAS